MATMRTPNEMVVAACEQMLDGKMPENRDDWVQVMNFAAYNVHPEAAEPACQVLRILYDMPLTEAEVVQIVEFQIAGKNA
jgi:hypothetical protein